MRVRGWQKDLRSELWDSPQGLKYKWYGVSPLLPRLSEARACVSNFDTSQLNTPPCPMRYYRSKDKINTQKKKKLSNEKYNHGGFEWMKGKRSAILWTKDALVKASANIWVDFMRLSSILWAWSSSLIPFVFKSRCRVFEFEPNLQILFFNPLLSMLRGITVNEKSNILLTSSFIHVSLW